jgi:hypothetical protein
MKEMWICWMKMGILDKKTPKKEKKNYWKKCAIMSRIPILRRNRLVRKRIGGVQIVRMNKP